jgi:hypothetical protein
MYRTTEPNDPFPQTIEEFTTRLMYFSLSRSANLGSGLDPFSITLDPYRFIFAVLTGVLPFGLPQISWASTRRLESWGVRFMPTKVLDGSGDFSVRSISLCLVHP